MNSINIIIQSTKTERGLEVEYNSFDNNISLLELSESLVDERDVPFKAQDKDAYSIQLSRNNKIYTLIFGIADFAGRPGYIGIKLYCQKNKNIPNFEAVLQAIKSEYEANSSVRSTQNHDYSEIISKVILEPGIQNVLTITKQGKYFCYYDNNTPNFERHFNSDLIYAVDKLYAFQKPNEEQNEIADLKSISLLEKKIEKTIIRGDLNLINEIKVNKQKLEFDSYQDKVTILLRDGENMAYAISQKALTQKNNDEIIISKKPVVPPKPKKATPAAWVFILGLLLGLIFGAGACYYFFPNTIYQQVTEDSIGGDKTELLADSIIFTKHNGEFKTTHPAFAAYTFKYANGKWTYSKNTNPNSYKDFYVSTLDSLKYEGKEISKDIKENFTRNLELVSQHSLTEKEKNKADDVKPSKPNTALKAKEATEKKVIKTVKKETVKSIPSSEIDDSKPGSKKNNDK